MRTVRKTALLTMSLLAIGCATNLPDPGSAGQLAAQATTSSAPTSTSAPRRGPPGGPGVQGLPTKYRNVNVRFAEISIIEAQQRCPQRGHPRLICLAEALKKMLSADRLEQIQLPYSVADARKWSNFPPMGYRDRVGLTLGDFDRAQLGYVKALLVEASGIAANEGYDELEQLLNADDFLLARAGERGFSSSNFHIAFLGIPTATGTWELQFGGHHTAFANTYVNGRLAGATPSFRGVEPFGRFEMNGRSNEPMAQEQAAFANLLRSLTPAQSGRARLSQTFTDVLVGPQKDDNFPAEREGIAGRDLTPAQRAKLLLAIGTYVRDVDPPNADRIMKHYEAELGDTFVAFSGPAMLDRENAYVRIDGPSVWIEYSIQPGRSIPGIHPHSVWRDRRSDYAGNR